VSQNDKDGSGCIEESGIVEETRWRTGKTDWYLSLYVNYRSQWMLRRDLFVAILAESDVKCVSEHPDLYIYKIIHKNIETNLVIYNN